MYVSSANKSGYPPINLDQAHQIFPEILNVYDFKKVLINQALYII
ncbi:hypothetical protein [Mycoplasmopsis felis]